MLEILRKIGKDYDMNGKTKEDLYNYTKELIIDLDNNYRLGHPVITDEEFDNLYIAFENFEAENPELKNKYSPTQMVYDVVIEELKKVRHTSFMGSQDKMKTEEDVNKFLSKISGPLAIDYKLDGITVVLRYNNGQLLQAITRGNGEVGEDITHAVSGFKNVPKTINYNKFLEVRAEALMDFKDFENVNKSLSVEDQYSNPRNLVAGTVRNLDGNRSKERNLKAIVFDVIESSEVFERGSDALSFLKDLGFETVESKLFNPEEFSMVSKYCSEFAEKERAKIPYMIDGLVLKADMNEERVRLGEKRKFPNWSAAYKFESLEARTILRDIEWNTGKTGKLTPVGIIDTVEIDNVNISRVTLNNYDWIKAFDLKINSEIMIARANDVIPKVVALISNDKASNIEKPSKCPACDSEVISEGANLFCINESCSAQVVEKLIHWCDRSRMDIPGLGVKVIQQLYDNDIVRSIPDLYYLKDKKEEFLALERQGEKSFSNAVEAIESSKSKSFEKVIYGLNIRNLGSVATKTFVKKYNSLSEIKKALKQPEKFKESLVSLEDFGEIMAMSVINYFSNPKNIELLHELEKVGFVLKDEVIEENISENNIKDKAFVITGTLSSPRSHYKKIIEDMGGKVRGSVSKNTDYILAGENAGSKKEKGIELGTTILTEEEFFQLINKD